MIYRLAVAFAVAAILFSIACAAAWIDGGLFGNIRRLYDEPIYTKSHGIDGRIEVMYWKEGFSVRVGDGPWVAGLGTHYFRVKLPGVSFLRMSRRAWGYEVEIRHGFLVAFFGLTAAFTAFTAKRVRRRQRHARGLCASCGYDLRASKDNCPECGAAIAAQSP